MTSEEFHLFMVALGFGFGSVFWLMLFHFLFGGRK